MEQTLDEIVRGVDAAIRGSDLLQAFDLARDGLKLYPDSEALKHKGILALARAGATDRAEVQFAESGLAQSPSGDYRALGARLLKDRALQLAGPERVLALRRAAEAYREVHRFWPNYFPAINWASLLRLAGDTAEARRVVREHVLGDPAIRDAADYWSLATRAEAEIVLGDRAAAAATLAAAMRLQGVPGDRSTTRRQLRLLLLADGLAAPEAEAFLATLAPPPTIHYSGHMIAGAGRSSAFRAADEAEVRRRIAAVLDELKPGVAFGSLASGADIIFAEELLARGAELNVVLPFGSDDFVAGSVRPAGESWVARFEACAARANRVFHATEGIDIGDASLYGYAARVAMGWAILRAQHLDGEAVQVAVWDGVKRAGPAGTFADVAEWKRSGPRRQIVVPLPRAGADEEVEGQSEARPFHAVVFGDVPGFSKMSEELLPQFWTMVMGAIGGALDKARHAVALANTWGDAIHLVVEDVRGAADLCLEIQHRLSLIDGSRFGRSGPLVMRIGAHYAPIYKGWDPVCRHETYYGRALSQAARIEPIAPAGRVYVTEAFAAIVTLEADDAFVCTYVGKVPLAKGFGEFRMYDLARRPPASEPAAAEQRTAVPAA